MKKLINTGLLSMILMATAISYSCQEDLPEAKTESNLLKMEVKVLEVRADSANIKASVKNYDSKLYSDGGFCWSKTSNPTIGDNFKSAVIIGDTTIEMIITELEPATKYYVKSYVLFNEAAIYSNEIELNIQDGIKILSTADITDILATSAKCGGNITSDGSFSITARGVCWNTSPNPTIASTKTLDGKGKGSFTSELTDLPINTVIYVRAYATNSLGTAYGSENSFKTNNGLPQLTTDTVRNIMVTKAQVDSKINSDGGFAITSRGICWNENGNPTTTDNKTNNGTGTGTFSSQLDGLISNTTYYCKAYATNNNGTAYGAQRIFKTLDGLPQLTTDTVKNILATEAIVDAKINSDVGFAITIRGICWSTSENPTTTDNKTTEGTGIGAFSSHLTELNPNTAYYCRAYATNTIGTSYGAQKSFVTKDGIPKLKTENVNNISVEHARVDGIITSDGGLAITSRGVCWSTLENPTIADSKTNEGLGTGSFSSQLSGLKSKTKYYCKVYATNNLGTVYGNQLSFITLDGTPKMFLASMKNITANSAIAPVVCISNGGYYIIQSGVCWSLSPNPTINDFKTIDSEGSINFESEITGLQPNTTYYVRAYGTNIVGTDYSNQQIFTTTPVNITGETGTVSDIDGNIYNWVGIGYQAWMAENLKTTKLNDGIEISLVSHNVDWVYNNTQAAYCYYNDDSNSSYGALYNYIAASKVCPVGWHLPSIEEYATLRDYIETTYPDSFGTTLKATNGWENNGNGTNNYNFSAQPGGIRNENGAFEYQGTQGCWWTLYIEGDKTLSTIFRLRSDYTKFEYTSRLTKEGMSVRCVKD